MAYQVNFYCQCGQRLRFGPNGQAQEIGGAILEHTGNCSRCKGQAAIDLPRFNGNPKAPTMGDLITPKQIGAVWRDFKDYAAALGGDGQR